MHLNELVVESRNPGFCLFGSIVNCLEKLLGLLHLWKACFSAEIAFFSPSCISPPGILASVPRKSYSLQPAIRILSLLTMEIPQTVQLTDSSALQVNFSLGVALGGKPNYITRCELRHCFDQGVIQCLVDILRFISIS